MESIIKNIDYDYIETKRAIERLCEEYPFLSSGIAGKSALGRNIPYIKLGRAEDNVLFAATIHGSEHITTNIILMFLEQLCFCLQNDGYIEGMNAKKAMHGRALIIVPVEIPMAPRFQFTALRQQGIWRQKLKSYRVATQSIGMPMPVELI